MHDMLMPGGNSLTCEVKLSTKENNNHQGEEKETHFPADLKWSYIHAAACSLCVRLG